MLSVADALAVVLSHCRPLSTETMPLSSSALGQVLAEDVASDLDMPPFDRAVMDGYAVRCGDLASGSAELTVLEEITAGKVPTQAVGPGQTSRVMTGAPLPEGAEAVVVIERSRLLDPTRVRLEDRPSAGQHIMRRGEEIRNGACVMNAGTVLRPQEFGMLAMVGRSAVRMFPRPRVAIIATGDELIEPSMKPGPGQIRNSNAPMLLAQTARVGALPRYLGIGRDRVESLRPLIQEGLSTADVLVLSGGVSAGTHDLVPGVLQQMGVVAHLHKVRLKPGKPFLFGTHESPAGKRLVFGLPGNPVSSLVCFELFLRPALRRLAGHADEGASARRPLVEAFSYKSDRQTYHPGRTSADGVRPVKWGGSSDLGALLNADVLIVLPEGSSSHEVGEMVEVLHLAGTV